MYKHATSAAEENDTIEIEIDTENEDDDMNDDNWNESESEDTKNEMQLYFSLNILVLGQICQMCIELQSKYIP